MNQAGGVLIGRWIGSILMIIATHYYVSAKENKMYPHRGAPAYESLTRLITLCYPVNDRRWIYTCRPMIHLQPLPELPGERYANWSFALCRWYLDTPVQFYCRVLFITQGIRSMPVISKISLMSGIGAPWLSQW